MKIRLSIPSTISSTTSVNKPAHAEGSAIHSIIALLLLCSRLQSERATAGRKSSLQKTQHLREDLWRGREHPTRLHPLLFTIEIGNQAARLQNQQAAGGEVPGLEADPTEAVDSAGCNVGQVEHRGTQSAHGGALAQHAGKAWITILRGLAQMSREQRVVVAGLATHADAPIIQE